MRHALITVAAEGLVCFGAGVDREEHALMDLARVGVAFPVDDGDLVSSLADVGHGGPGWGVGPEGHPAREPAQGAGPTSEGHRGEEGR